MPLEGKMQKNLDGAYPFSVAEGSPRQRRKTGSLKSTPTSIDNHLLVTTIPVVDYSDDRKILLPTYN